jgi:hypothetical protein
VAGSAVMMPYVVGVRLTKTDKAKLDSLCAHAQRQPSDLLRVLIRLAQPIDVLGVPIEFPTIREREETCVG